MNRQILFRGKTEKGEWLFGFYHNETSIESPSSDRKVTRHHIYTQDFDKFVIPETVGQFTGLTDKNGKKIFEGDIVAYNTLYIDGKEHQEIGYFECDENFVSFKIHGTQMTPFHCEVIGNIYDNPELLKVENEQGQDT